MSFRDGAFESIAQPHKFHPRRKEMWGEGRGEEEQPCPRGKISSGWGRNYLPRFIYGTHRPHVTPGKCRSGSHCPKPRQKKKESLLSVAHNHAVCSTVDGVPSHCPLWTRSLPQYFHELRQYSQMSAACRKPAHDLLHAGLAQAIWNQWYGGKAQGSEAC